MKWPWVSRHAFDLLREQVEFYRGQVERSEKRAEMAMDALVRLRRIEQGAPEAPRRPVERTPPPPPEFMEYVNGFQSDHLKRALMKRAESMVRAGQSWGDVLKMVQTEGD